MFDAWLSGLASVFYLDTFYLLLIGTAIGYMIGFIPGLAGAFALAMLIPFTFSMEPGNAVVLLLATHAVVMTGGSYSAILFNAPGTGANIPASWEGYPLTQKGQGGRAIAAAATSSAIGGAISGIVLMGLIPVVRMILLSFTPPEFFMLSILAYSFVAGLVGKHPFRALVAVFAGILLSTVGIDPVLALPRFSLGTFYLWEGVKLVPLVMGMFAVSEMIKLAVSGQGIVAGSVKGGVKIGHDVFKGVKETFQHWFLVLRCSGIASIIGIIPGLGAELATFMCYGHALQTSKHPEEFGKGSIEGIIGAEAGNNGKEGGSLLTTLAFGVPGSSSMAILLGFFITIGIVPSPEMLKQNLPLVFSMAWVIIIANILGAAISIFAGRYMAWLSAVRAPLLVSILLVVTVIGGAATHNNLGDIVTTFFFGFVGYQMDKYGYSKAAFIVGFVLGKITEKNLLLSLQIYQGVGFLTRPLTLGLAAIAIFAFAWPFFKRYRDKAKMRGGTSNEI